MSDLRKKLEGKEKIRGALVSLTDPCLCEIMGVVGYDCVWIDTEHTYMSNKEVLCHLNAARSSGISAIVRLPQNDLTATKRILEMGPDGVIFPMVRSASEVEELIDMTLYPPLGTRGFGPMRAIKYGECDVGEYVNRGSLDMCRFVQIEHIDAIDELEKIIEIPYVDGFIFGPNDLSASLGDNFNVFAKSTQDAIKRAMKILKEHGKCAGVAVGCSEQIIRAWSEYDFDMFFSGADWNFIFGGAKETLQILKKHF